MVPLVLCPRLPPPSWGHPATEAGWLPRLLTPESSTPCPAKSPGLRAGCPGTRRALPSSRSPPDALAGPAALMGPERRASRGWRAVQAPWERWQLPSDNDTPVRFMAAISSGGADELFIGSFSKQGGGRAGWCPGERS